jgi:hypothetical protein
MSTDAITFDVRHGDDLIRVYITQGFATFQVSSIDDARIVIEALNRAAAAGAKRGTMLTGAVVHDQLAAMHMMRAEQGITWLGGRVTFLGSGPSGPEFEINWDALPTVTK